MNTKQPITIDNKPYEIEWTLKPVDPCTDCEKRKNNGKCDCQLKDSITQNKTQLLNG